MYGGGFATIPAYLRDIFGTMQVGAIHGRLLTAWSVAGVLGPVLVNYIRAYQIDNGVPKAQAYSVTMYIMCALAADRLHMQFRDACGRTRNITIRLERRRRRRPGASNHEGAAWNHVARGRNSVIVGSVENAAKCFEIISMTRRATPGDGVRHEH